MTGYEADADSLRGAATGLDRVAGDVAAAANGLDTGSGDLGPAGVDVQLRRLTEQWTKRLRTVHDDLAAAAEGVRSAHEQYTRIDDDAARELREIQRWQ